MSLNLLPIVLVLAACSTACSFRQATYRYADWLVEHRIKNYFDLETSQVKLLPGLVDQALNDVNEHAFPKIVSYLVTLSVKTNDGSLSEDDATWLMMRYNEGIALLIDATADEMATLLATLTKRQIEHFKGELKKEAEEHEKRLTESEADFRDKDMAVFHKRFGRVIGDLSEDQEAKFAVILDMTKTQGQDRFRIRQEMNESFVSFLETQPSTDVISQQIRAWSQDRGSMIKTPELKQRYLQRAAAMAHKLVELDKVLRPEQRSSISKELMSLSVDLQEMSRVKF